MNWTLEVVAVPVADVERAKRFYADQLGFDVDHDSDLMPPEMKEKIGLADGMRIVQLTPPGSGCSIVLGAPGGMEPGTLRGVQLVVPDLEAALAELTDRGVEVSEIQVIGESPSPTPHPLDNVGFFFFSDPDGNGWAVQQISSRG